jgi:uridine kinase
MPGSAAADVAALALARQPTLGDGRLVCVDGPAGAGKTTLATAVAALHPHAALVHLDDLYEGWDGLPRLTVQLDGLLRPLADRRTGSYRRYDWEEGRFAETRWVAPAPVLVLEGVGAGSLDHADLITVLVWVEAPYDVRMARGLARDGEAFAPHWKRWAAGEVEYFRRHDTRGRADLILTTA